MIDGRGRMEDGSKSRFFPLPSAAVFLVTLYVTIFPLPSALRPSPQGGLPSSERSGLALCSQRYYANGTKGEEEQVSKPRGEKRRKYLGIAQGERDGMEEPIEHAHGDPQEYAL